MPPPPSKLRHSVCLSDREFDEIISSMSEEELVVSVSDDAFERRSMGSPDDNSHQNMKPIPANRIALLRQIDERRLEERKRKRFRDLGYKAVLVVVIIVGILLLCILGWMFYLAWDKGGNKRFAMKPIKIHNNGSQSRNMILDDENVAVHGHIAHVPRKLATNGHHHHKLYAKSLDHDGAENHKASISKM